MKLTSILVGFGVAIVALAGGDVRGSDLEEIKATQAKILERLDNQDRMLKDIQQKLQAQAQAQAGGRPSTDPNKIYSLNLGNSPIRGKREAAVTMVEFSDYQCPFCAQSTSLVEQLLAAYPKDLRFVYKHMPLTQIHQNALNASKAAIAAGMQGKFWEMHDALFAISKNLVPDEVKKAAATLGLDAAKLEADMASPEIDKVLQEDLNAARAADVTGTPTFFINGKRVMTRSFEGMKAMIDEELNRLAQKS